MQTVTHLKEFQDKPQFFWDFWQIYNHEKQDFDVLVLHARADLVADEKHHFSSAIAHCKTQDFKVMYDVSLNVFQASTGWDNTSIWSGDVIWYKDRFLFFYTSRNLSDFYTQHIGLAVSQDMLDWCCWALKYEACQRINVVLWLYCVLWMIHYIDGRFYHHYMHQAVLEKLNYHSYTKMI